MQFFTPNSEVDLCGHATIADSLHISPEELVAELPIQIVSTGLRDILIPVQSLDILKRINPDFKLIAEISKWSKWKWAG